MLQTKLSGLIQIAQQFFLKSINGVQNDGGDITILSSDNSIIVTSNDTTDTIDLAVANPGTTGLASLNNVTNNGGNIDLSSTGNTLTITADDVTNRINLEVANPGIRSLNAVENAGGNITLVSTDSSVTITPNAVAKTINLSAPGSAGGILSINNVQNTGGNVSLISGNNTIQITSNDATNTIDIRTCNGITSINGVAKPCGDFLVTSNFISVTPDNYIGSLKLDITNSSGPIIQNTLTNFIGASTSSSGSRGLVPSPSLGIAERYLSSDATFRKDNSISGQSGSGSPANRVLRINSANVWVQASNTDTLDQLNPAALAFLDADFDMLLSGSVVRGLSGLTVGAVYYLGTSGLITTTVPTLPSKKISIGVANSTTSLIFCPQILA